MATTAMQSAAESSQPSGGGTIAKALADVQARAARAAAASGWANPPRLVAVSKTKPAEALKEAYDAGQRTFGENYVQEMVDKAPQLPADIRWHFIGHLQSNKVKTVLEAVPNLAMVETVDTAKLADKLNKAIEVMKRPEPLAIMIQVNTSGEESKHGIQPGEVVALARHVHTKCPHLCLAGLMTIGQPDYSSRPENFDCLVACRAELCKDLGLPLEQIELSMGMSGDFEQAIAMGSTNIRVGSTIFGSR